MEEEYNDDEIYHPAARDATKCIDW